MAAHRARQQRLGSTLDDRRTFQRLAEHQVIPPLTLAGSTALDPLAYLRNVLIRVDTHPARRPTSFLRTVGRRDEGRQQGATLDTARRNEETRAVSSYDAHT
jgi:hypothetical protein